MKVCIIGTGAISGNHISAVLAAGEEIAGLCDLSLDKARRKGLEFGLTCPVFTDYAAMIDLVRPDVVHICTPHYLHAEMVKYALGRNVAVLSEKPACINAAQLRDLKETHEKFSAPYGVCFQNRYLEINRAARSYVAGAKVFGASGAVLWNRDEKYYASGEWRGTWNREGGGVLINQSVHTLDLMVDALGAPISVSAKMSNEHLRGIIEVEDTMQITMKYPDFTALFTATTAAADSYPVCTAFYTDRGIVETRGGVVTVNGVEIPSEKKARLAGKSEWGAGHDMLIADFYACVKEGKLVTCDFNGCVDTMKTVFAAYRSAKTQREITLEEIEI